MNLKTISRNVGFALLVSALFMFFSIIISMMEGNDSALAALIISFTITFIVGIFPFIFVRKTSRITLKEGYVIIVLSWLLSFIFGMLPYALWGGPFTLQNAWFESVSGFTTTGATILENVEILPDSLLFWRASTHFIGGLGVVVFLLLLIPGATQMKMRLTNMELSSVSKSGYSSRPNKTIFIFTYVYFGLLAASFIAYLLCGMKPLDAICHAMSVCSTGGFSTRNLSIAAFDSSAVELVTMVFMYLGSIHFGIIFLTIVNQSFKPLNNPVLKFYSLSLLVVTLILTFSIRSSYPDYSFARVLGFSAFQTISVASTSGLAITDNANWPMFANSLLLFLAIMCGCAGSTSGGVKADRILVLIKSFGMRIAKILHPYSVDEVRIGVKVLSDEESSSQVLYVAIYFLLLLVSVMLSLLLNATGVSAISGSLCMLGNIGPGLGEIGFMGNYNMIPSAVKMLFTFDMFLGRVEIYPVLAVVAMVFDSRKN